MIKSIDGRFLSNNIDPQGPFKECPTNGLIIRSVFVGEKPKNTHKFFHIQTYHPPTQKKKPVIYQHNNYFVTYLQKIYIEEMEDEDVSEDNNTSSLPQEQPNNRVME
mmetsp:Transcript_12757/g.19775  ORF Transcript_12757/g.19775 Transcript_12757/m.19775 type:complete len:107 (+) Transcript_12757:475-795(+)